MDTRFWGPSGWRLLHLITFAANTLPKADLHAFFEALPYVLPCKYCRASLADYYTADPIPTKAADYAPWLYRIHNRVNGKLRDQKLVTTKDPLWPAVKREYETWLSQPCTKRRMVGWDFLFSVAYTTPCPAVKSSPMPSAPPLPVLTTPELRNRWSLMPTKERLCYMKRWWGLLPRVLPFPEWRTAWTRVVPTTLSLGEGRRAVTSWLYAAEKAMCTALKEDLPHESFTGLCSELDTFASGCGRAKHGKLKTCRAVKSHAKQTLKKRRSTTYKAVGGFL